MILAATRSSRAQGFRVQSTTQSSSVRSPEERRRAVIARVRAANERPEPAAERLGPAPVMGVALLLRGRALVDEIRGSTPATLRSEGRKLRRGLAGPVGGGSGVVGGGAPAPTPLLLLLAP